MKTLQVTHPLLKFVRGEQLSADHWLDMFRLLKLPKGTTLEKLTFGDILKVADEIISNADAIKVTVICMKELYLAYKNEFPVLLLRDQIFAIAFLITHAL